jgi:2-oxoglutarate dehydrogenase E2 component (dihydrolipoamide succinyltransferase)
MATSVTMPRLGESVTEGTVTRWLKQEGDHVDTDEPLLEVSTDKVDTEVPSPAAGTVLSIKVREDETVEIGVELAVIGEEGEGGGQADGAPQEQAEPEPEGEQQPEPEPQQAAEPPDAAGSAEAEEDSPTSAPAPSPSPYAGAAPQPDGATYPEAAAEPQQESESQQKSEAQPKSESQQRSQEHQNAPSGQQPSPQQPATRQPSAQQQAGDEDEVAGTYVTPLVRKLAGEHGVDLSSVQGTGVGGRIRKSDVLAAAQAQQDARQQADEEARSQAARAQQGDGPATSQSTTAPQATSASRYTAVRGRTEPMSRMRQVIATRMVESLQLSAQLTTVVEVDVTRIARLRQRARGDFEAREGVKLSFLPFFAVAAVEALKAHPVVNASVDMEQKTITYHDAEHLGIAVDTDRGLLVPVIHNAGDLNLGGIARKIADLAERTRANRVAPDELGGGTFTLTNTGSRGALFDTPIINQPQVAILGTGAVVKRPVVVTDDDLGETIAVRSMVYLALSYDHRVVDGADAARFLTTVKQRLEAGAFEKALGL